MRYFLRGLIGITIVVAVWEAAARIEDWWTHDAPLLGRYDATLLSAFDEFGVHGRPHAKYLKWQLNSLGYRGPELRAGSDRLLVIGASETFGLYESFGHEYPRLLEQELRSRPGSGRIEVVNAGFVGQGLPAITRRIERIANTVRPRWALLYPSVANYISPPPPFRPGIPPPPPPSNWQIRCLNRIETLSRRTLPSALQTVMRQAVIWKDSRGLTVMERVPEARVELLDRDMTDMIRRLRQFDIQPVVVTHATRFGPGLTTEDREMLIAWRKFFPELREKGFLDMENRMNQRLRELAKREDLPLIDAAVEMPSGPKMFADFVHFTDAGAQQMAALLARQLQPMLAAPGGGETRTQAAGIK
jgi:hypothetical protein